MSIPYEKIAEERKTQFSLHVLVGRSLLVCEIVLWFTQCFTSIVHVSALSSSLDAPIWDMTGLIDKSKTTWTSVSGRIQGKNERKSKRKEENEKWLPNRKGCVDTRREMSQINWSFMVLSAQKSAFPQKGSGKLLGYCPASLDN